MKPRILFLDDEPLALDGLQRMLRSMRMEWEMVFVEDAAQALQCMTQSPFDVVVSDMLMPGMTGAQFLNEVRASHPKAVRLVLSGHADHDLIVQCLKSTHQYLAKPCQAETLKSVLSQVSTLRAALPNSAIRQVVTQIYGLPNAPALCRELDEKLRQADARADAITSLVSSDVGMTAKVLQWVNAGFFGTRKVIASPAEAISCLGLEILKDLVLTHDSFAPDLANAVPDDSLDELRKHSIAAAQAARILADAEQCEQRVVEQAFTAGLLHDAGKFVLVSHFGDQYSDAMKLANTQKIDACTAEKEAFGVSHTEIGGYLFRLWGLPAPLVDAAFFHHEPRSKPTAAFSALTAVHVGDALVHEFERATDGPPKSVDRQYLEDLGLTGRLADWREALRQHPSFAA